MGMTGGDFGGGGNFGGGDFGGGDFGGGGVVSIVPYRMMESHTSNDRRQ